MINKEQYTEYIINTPLYVNSSLTLFLCGWENCKSRHSFGPAIRAHYLFHYILRGKGKFYVGNRCYNLSANEGFLIFPGESTYYEADENDPWDYCWFGFDGYEVKSILDACNLSDKNPIFKDESQGRFKEELLNLVELFESSHFNEYEAMGHLYLVFAKMYQKKKEQNKAFDKTYFDKAVDFIQHNYSYHIKIEDIAKNIGIDRTYLYKIFKKVHNISPQLYLINYRLHMACKLLENTNISITEVSYSCGFKNTPAFYKQFKKYYGITPSEYRNRYIWKPSYEPNEKNSPNQ